MESTLQLFCSLRPGLKNLNMRYLLTSLLCVLTLSLTAQVDCPNPYDGNGDGNVSIGDFLEMLAVFGDTDTDSDGVWDSLDDCVDLAACNYANDHLSLVLTLMF